MRAVSLSTVSLLLAALAACAGSDAPAPGAPAEPEGPDTDLRPDQAAAFREGTYPVAVDADGPLADCRAEAWHGPVATGGRWVCGEPMLLATVHTLPTDEAPSVASYTNRYLQTPKRLEVDHTRDPRTLQAEGETVPAEWLLPVDIPLDPVLVAVVTRGRRQIVYSCFPAPEEHAWCEDAVVAAIPADGRAYWPADPDAPPAAPRPEEAP